MSDPILKNMDAEAMSSADSNGGQLVFIGTINRQRHGRRISFEVKDEPKACSAKPRALQAAHLLALAYKIQQGIDGGKYRDLADAARRFGITKPRITQILNLTLLTPEIQEQILDPIGNGDASQMSERKLRRLTVKHEW